MTEPFELPLLRLYDFTSDFFHGALYYPDRAAAYENLVIIDGDVISRCRICGLASKCSLLVVSAVPLDALYKCHPPY